MSQFAAFCALQADSRVRVPAAVPSVASQLASSEYAQDRLDSYEGYDRWGEIEGGRFAIAKGIKDDEKKGMLFKPDETQLLWDVVKLGFTFGLWTALWSVLDILLIYDANNYEMDASLVEKIKNAYDANDTMTLRILCGVLKSNEYEIKKVKNGGKSCIDIAVYVQRRNVQSLGNTPTASIVIDSIELPKESDGVEVDPEDDTVISPVHRRPSDDTSPNPYRPHASEHEITSTWNDVDLVRGDPFSIKP